MTKTNITIRTTKKALEAIKVKAERMNISSNAYINLLFTKELDDYDKERNKKF